MLALGLAGSLGLLAQAFGVRDLPSTFLIGRDGRTIGHWIGFSRENRSEMDSAMKAALAL